MPHDNPDANRRRLQSHLDAPNRAGCDAAEGAQPQGREAWEVAQGERRAEVNILAIDPGASGGIAVWNPNELLTDAFPMPDGMCDQVDCLRSITASLPDWRCVMERTGTYVPGNSGPSAAKFARHCGHLEAALYVMGIPTTQVAPQKWMKALGALPHDKAERKRAIRELMARRYPHLEVTLKTADALGILTYALNNKQTNS
jgi:hypothetical protein